MAAGRADAGHAHASDFQRLAALGPPWRLRRPDQPGEAVLFARVEPTDAVAVDAQRRAFVDAQPGHVGHTLATQPGDAAHQAAEPVAPGEVAVRADAPPVRQVQVVVTQDHARV